MGKPTNWIRVSNADTGHYEMYQNFRDVLWDMGIDIWKDEDLASESAVDLFICLEKREETNE
tara:strand:- start:25712 stop:25897 length:186 start_codon:yes stop_codon:yes gene_type:complete